MMGRLVVGSVITPTDSPSSSVQAGHKAKSEYSGTDDGHDPMDLCRRRPSVPSVKVVRTCQTPMCRDGGRTKDRWE